MTARASLRYQRGLLEGARDQRVYGALRKWDAYAASVSPPLEHATIETMSKRERDFIARRTRELDDAAEKRRKEREAAGLPPLLTFKPPPVYATSPRRAPRWSR